MKRNRRFFLSFGLLSATMLSAVAWSDDKPAEPADKKLCTDAWYQVIEKQLPTGDANKHGPQAGSDEWKQAVERKLNVSGKADVPARDQESWCRYIDQLVHDGDNGPGSASPQGPSFGCSNVQADSIEALICNDNELSMLDRKLASAYAGALKNAKKESSLDAEQRGWLKGRNECWKSEEKGACVRDAYYRRIAELQAVYGLVTGIGPTFFQCKGKPGAELVVTFFATDPRTLIAKYQGSSSLMYVVPSGSGTRYQGRNETFWEHQGEATIVWGPDSPQVQCTKAQ